MATSKIKVDISIRHMWLIKLINYPLIILGLDTYIPKICVKVSEPYFTEGL